MGHGSYMKTYNKRTPEERKADYLKCADALSIMKPSESITRQEVDKLATLKGLETALRYMPMKGSSPEQLYEDFRSRRGLERDLTIEEKIEILDRELQRLSTETRSILEVREEALLSNYGGDAVIQKGLGKLNSTTGGNSIARKLVIPEDLLQKHLDEGWNVDTALPSGKIVIKK